MLKIELLIPLFLAGCASTSKISSTYAYEDFQKAYTAGSAVLLPDGSKALYITNRDKYPMLWAVDLKSGTESKLLNFDRPLSDVFIAPNGKYAVFLADDNGDENYQLFSLDLATKDVTPLASRPRSKFMFCGWNEDGTRVSFTNNARSAGYFDLSYVDLTDAGIAKRPAKVFLKSDHINICGEFSKSKKQYTYVRFISNLRQEIHTVDLESGKDRRITPAEESVYEDLVLSKDGKTAFTVSDKGSEFRQLVRVDLSSGTVAPVSRVTWDVLSFFVSRDHSTAGFVFNENGFFKLKLFKGEFKEEISLDAPAGAITARNITPDGKHILVSIDKPTAPAEFFAFDVNAKKWNQISRLNQSPVPEHVMSMPKVVTFNSKDGLAIGGLLYLPKQASAKNPVPAIVMVHGGPEDQATAKFSDMRQFLVSQGFAILMPNFRGSTGYGKSFRKRVYGDWGGKHIDDVMAGREYIAQMPEIDPKRIAILGGSFGGFSVLSSITQHPKSFCAAVDIFGPTNLLSFISSVPPHWRETTYALVGHPDKDHQMLLDRSPINHLEKIEIPLLVIQGTKDPRVIKAESDQLVAGLEKLRRKVEYIVFADEGHGFSKNENAAKAFVRASDFLSEVCP